jgi:hypothetical protein
MSAKSNQYRPFAHAPNEREVEMVDPAFGTDPGTTSNPGGPTLD